MTFLCALAALAHHRFSSVKSMAWLPFEVCRHTYIPSSPLPLGSEVHWEFCGADWRPELPEKGMDWRRSPSIFLPSWAMAALVGHYLARCSMYISSTGPMCGLGLWLTFSHSGMLIFLLDPLIEHISPGLF